MEIVYTENGLVQGVGWGAYGLPVAWTAQISGTWQSADNGAVCSTIMLDGATIRASLPLRCRYWFELNAQYYVSDSASDRSAAMLRRMIAKSPSAPNDGAGRIQPRPNIGESMLTAR